MNTHKHVHTHTYTHARTHTLAHAHACINPNLNKKPTILLNSTHHPSHYLYSSSAGSSVNQPVPNTISASRYPITQIGILLHRHIIHRYHTQIYHTQTHHTQICHTHIYHTQIYQTHINHAHRYYTHDTLHNITFTLYHISIHFIYNIQPFLIKIIKTEECLVPCKHFCTYFTMSVPVCSRPFLWVALYNPNYQC